MFEEHRPNAYVSMTLKVAIIPPPLLCSPEVSDSVNCGRLKPTVCSHTQHIRFIVGMAAAEVGNAKPMTSKSFETVSKHNKCSEHFWEHFWGIWWPVRNLSLCHGKPRSNFWLAGGSAMICWGLLSSSPGMPWRSLRDPWCSRAKIAAETDLVWKWR